jgi:hypothetical protein
MLYKFKASLDYMSQEPNLFMTIFEQMSSSDQKLRQYALRALVDFGNCMSQ